MSDGLQIFKLGDLLKQPAPPRPSPLPVAELLGALKTSDPAKRRRLRYYMAAYGVWRCRDDKRVVFNRAYVPVWEKRPGGERTLLAKGYWVEGIVATSWFYTDSDRDESLKLRKALAGMVKLGIAPAVAILHALKN
jgi:hypothetical protein